MSLISGVGCDGKAVRVSRGGVEHVTADVTVLRQGRTKAQVQALLDALCRQESVHAQALLLHVESLNPVAVASLLLTNRTREEQEAEDALLGSYWWERL